MLSKTRNASNVRNRSATRIAGFISGNITRRESLPCRGAIHLGRVQQFVGHKREAGEQQQGHERCCLPDLSQDDDTDGWAKSASAVRVPGSAAR